jgi:hypothetical protein
MGGLHIAFKDALNNLHLKSSLRSLFQQIDPMHSKEWPHGFLAFLNSKAETKEDSASAKKFASSGGFAGANTQQLCFAEKIEERGALSRKVINNFLNPNWTADYGSGGNEEGHLLLMRSNYYKSEFILKNAKRNVQAFVTQLKKKPTRKSIIFISLGPAGFSILDSGF